jgi:hypothetical protein
MTIKAKVDLRSDVEKNSDLVKVGSVLFYVDSENCERFTVTELIEDGFIAKSKYEERPFWFNELAYGWQFGAVAA